MILYRITFLSFPRFFFSLDKILLSLKHGQFICFYKKPEDPYGCELKIKTALDVSSISRSRGLSALNLTWGEDLSN